MNQKTIFLESEGDKWFERNKNKTIINNICQDDLILNGLTKIIESSTLPLRPKLLEVGCGEGLRLDWIHRTLGFECNGLDPSLKAIEVANSRGLKCIQGTADLLPYEDNSIDILIYGFCLYLCDRNDLFQIASEGHRVLKRHGWIIIKDFFSPKPCQREYHHRSGIFSYKMDCRTLFEWHPDYQNFSHDVVHHSGNVFTDDVQEWVAVSIIRKQSAQ